MAFSQIHSLAHEHTRYKVKIGSNVRKFVDTSFLTQEAAERAALKFVELTKNCLKQFDAYKGKEPIQKKHMYQYIIYIYIVTQ